ncbi:hypothetical protein B0A54_17425 [Friedmanniomyces endolithicus]|uniref:Uncharacterized protein n=1 Tax=Friedmanniomyces endolithicus TaxID=329885 RepID=A0A4U0TTM7_9PEZI|nr:hypothetical protein B0A54_17425 [Friedmanniomyces endolithicus]
MTIQAVIEMMHPFTDQVMVEIGHAIRDGSMSEAGNDIVMSESEHGIEYERLTRIKIMCEISIKCRSRTIALHEMMYTNAYTMMCVNGHESSYGTPTGNGSESLTLYVFKPTDAEKYSNGELNT